MKITGRRREGGRGAQRGVAAQRRDARRGFLLAAAGRRPGEGGPAAGGRERAFRSEGEILWSERLGFAGREFRFPNFWRPVLGSIDAS